MPRRLSTVSRLRLLLAAAPLAAAPLAASCAVYTGDDDFAPGDDDTTPGADDDTVPDPPADCSEQVTLPISLLQLEPPGPADPHDDVYGADPTPFQVVYGWPSSDPSRSAAFVWRTDLDTRASVVEYGAGDSLDRRAEGGTFTYSTMDGGEQRVHEVRLCGRLVPGTLYSYRVGGDGAWSEVHQFTTPGAPGSFDTFRVGVAGDSRGGTDVWGQIVAAMEAHAPDLVVFPGDMIDLGVTQAEWDAWFEAAGDLFARKAVLPSPGNHELLSVAYFSQFVLPGRELYYSVDYGTLHLVSLADMNLDWDTLYGEVQDFLAADLAASAQPWKVPFHHWSPYSACTTHGSFTELRDSWVPLYEQHGVDLVLNGHNHLYERSVPIRAGAEVAPGEGPVYVVTGGAGAPLYEDVADEWFGAVAIPIEHYLILDVTPERLAATAYDLSGNVLDQFDVPAG